MQTATHKLCLFFYQKLKGARRLAAFPPATPRLHLRSPRCSASVIEATVGCRGSPTDWPAQLLSRECPVGRIFPWMYSWVRPSGLPSATLSCCADLHPVFLIRHGMHKGFDAFNACFDC